MQEQLFFCYLAGVPLLGIIAQWLAWRLRLPSILLLLAFGVALGWYINPDDLLANLANLPESDTSFAPKILFPVVSLSVAVILFEGGLTLKLSELKQSGGVVLRLVTIGVFVSWILTAAAAHVLVGLDVQIAALIGAILVVTGPTVIAPLLRHIQPARKIGSIVKWEGIVIDPVGAILAVLVFQVISGSGGAVNVAVVLLTTIGVSCLLGLVAGILLVAVVRRYWVPDFLQGVLFLTVAMGVFAVSNLIQPESGLVTVTLLGVYLANQKHISVQHVLEFKEHLVVLLISCLFIVLGSRLQPKQLMELGWGGLAFLVVMILVVRPASIFLATIRSNVTMRERVFLSLLAPRGIVAAAVTSVFALEVAHHGSLAPLQEDAESLVPLTFLVIVGTVAFYGLLAGPIARKLNLAESNPQGILFSGAAKWIQEIAKLVAEEGFAVVLIDTNYRLIAAARMAGLEAECTSILSEHALEETELGGIGRLLAVTSNDEVNVLAAREWSHQFGRAGVYQLAPWDAGAGHRESVSGHHRGRILFDESLHHDKLANLLLHTHELKKTKLTDEFTFEQFQERYGESSIILFVIDESKKLKINIVDDSLTPKAGQTVIALVERETSSEDKVDSSQ